MLRILEPTADRFYIDSFHPFSSFSRFYRPYFLNPLSESVFTALYDNLIDNFTLI